MDRHLFISGCAISIAFTCVLSGCGDTRPKAEYRTATPRLVTNTVPIVDHNIVTNTAPRTDYRTVTNVFPEGNYKVETEKFIDRLKIAGRIENAKAWAVQLLQTHSNDNTEFSVPHSEWPDFIWKLDPQIEPSIVLVVPKNYVTIAWGGGFGWWGLILSDHDFAYNNPTFYIIKWAPGVEVFHDIQ